MTKYGVLLTDKATGDKAETTFSDMETAKRYANRAYFEQPNCTVTEPYRLDKQTDTIHRAGLFPLFGMTKGEVTV